MADRHSQIIADYQDFSGSYFLQLRNNRNTVFLIVMIDAPSFKIGGVGRSQQLSFFIFFLLN
ncbi:hypothetical protein AHMF7616_03043 [Adhaeribacter pallidiroseus]|uniref:Uncharacterized protein n=1 Tax=Adhaeribacter pallidiroseus TaxID=2072847 RepID=A0A369QNJ4_9BACT|nr:hypothetical protein AHMF7616_03043 [Adhaeribacter pallidiroseus]